MQSLNITTLDIILDELAGERYKSEDGVINSKTWSKPIICLDCICVGSADVVKCYWAVSVYCYCVVI